MRNFNRSIKISVMIVCIAAVVVLLDMALYPCTFIRNDVHTVTKQYHDDILLGSSHGKMNVDPDILAGLTGRSTHNMCAGGQYAADSYYLLKLLIEKQKPKRIIFEADPGYLLTEKQAGDNELLFVHEFPLSAAKLEYFTVRMRESDFRSVFFPWYEYPLAYELKNWRETIRRKWENDYSVSYFAGKVQQYHENGWIEKYDADISKQKLTVPSFLTENKIHEENVSYLRDLIRLCKKENIEFVAFTAPMPDKVLEQVAAYEAAYEKMADVFSSEEVVYWNFNTVLYDKGCHEASYFVDLDGHMNKEGAEEFSTMLGEMLADR